jgi:hypothetical protein
VDILEHFAAVRPPRGQEQCACCEGDGVHETRLCARCGGSGFVRAGSADPFCPGREDDQPGPPKRRHWREGARRDPWHGEGPWYHGTPEELSEGDVIVPGDVIGKQHMGRGSDSARAWVTNDPWKAHSYGINIYEVDPSTRPKSMYARHHEHYLPDGGTARVIRQVPYEEATALSPEYQRGKKIMEKQVRQIRREQREAAQAGHSDYGPLYDKRPPEDEARALVTRRIDKGMQYKREYYPELAAHEKFSDHFDIEPIVRRTTAMGGRPYMTLHWGVTVKGKPAGYVSSNYEGTRHSFQTYWWDPKDRYDPQVHGEPQPSQTREERLYGPRQAALAERPEYGPEPEYQRPPEGAGDEEQSAVFERNRARRRAWNQHVKRGLSLGHLSAGHAKGLGYYFSGHETDRHGEPGWQPLPEEMYHATTDLAGVRAHGLKTRDELGQRGHGLGGGEDDTISVTTDHQLGRGILHGLHEMHRVVNGRYTPAQMWEDAKAGTGASRPFHADLMKFWDRGWKEGDELPRGLHNAIHGIERKHTMGSTQEDMPGWRPARGDEGWMSGHTPPRQVHLDWERDMTPDERRDNAADFYQKFSAFREHAGGPEDPLFWTPDTKAFAAKDPKNFALLHVRPAPGGHGYPMGGMREWRTGTGDALQVHHYEQLHDRGQLHTAVFSCQAGDPGEYGMGHKPDTGGPPLHDLLDSGGTDWGMPPDIYDNLHQYNYGEGNTGWDAMAKIRKFRGQPDKRVRIWRSAPAVNPESRNSKRGEINQGDWVALSKEKALRESYEVNDPPRGSLPANHPNRYHIWSALVPARHVRNADGDITEWGYSGPDIKDIPHISEQCSHRARVLPEGAERPQRAPRQRSFWDTDYSGKHHFGSVSREPAAERTERVDHMLRHYAPTDFGTWAEVDHNVNWHVPEVASFVADVARNGVKRPIPVDYEQDPPRVMNGHKRLLAAARAGVETVPTRQHEGFMDPDDPDHLGRGPDDPGHWTNQPHWHEGAVRTTWFAVGPALSATAADLFHGSDRDEPFTRFDFHRRSLKSEEEEESPLYKQEGEGMTTRWWNSRLGSHFTSEHGVVSEIAQRMGGGGNVYHVELRQRNPKHYPSEHDLAEEGVTWARKNGYTGLRNLGFDTEQGWHHADALQNHPKAQEIAEGFRAHLQRQGYDGITYGNEYEGTKGHLSAIAFHPDQVKITETHGGYEPCRFDDMRHEAALPLRNPHTGGREWYHGTQAEPEELKPHGFADPMSMAPGAYEHPESEEGGHWNALLGTHFTADHDVARAFAEGEHSSGANERHGEWEGNEWGEPHRGIVHARLGLKNPRVYGSEHDMDHEAYEHEYAAGNHPSDHVPGIGRAAGEGDEDEQYEAEEMWHHAHQIAKDYGHGKIPASTYGHMRTPFEGHPMRTAWLNTHPDKWGIANRFRERLQAAGHDGVIYGNEYERSRRGPEANKSAIVFDPGRIHVTQHHHADEPCDPELHRQAAAEHEHVPLEGQFPGHERCAICGEPMWHVHDWQPAGETAQFRKLTCPGCGESRRVRKREPWTDPEELHREGAVFVPSERIFGPTYGLDHRLFDEAEHLRTAVRDTLMGRLHAVLSPVLGPDWDAVTRAYLAGSQASKWTGPEREGNRDLDVLVGVAHSHARRAVEAFSGLTDAQIDERLNRVLQEHYNAPGWHPPFDPGGQPWDLTGHTSPLDIRRISPYAAYDLTRDAWAVRPPDLPQWSAEQFPQGPAVFQLARGLISQVRATLRLPEPFRHQEAERIWRYIREGRGESFAPGGLGWQGTGNVLEKALDQASGQLVAKLKQAVYGPSDAPQALGHGMTTADPGSARA